MDKFESMAAFVAVVEAGGFTAASRRTRMPLASVSRKVSDLETLLNVVLIARSGRGIKLTESGERYYADCRRLLDELGEVERAASGEYIAPRGDLVVTAPVVFGRLHLTPIAVEFLNAWPDGNLCLRLRDDIANLSEEKIDLAVRISRLPDSNMIARRIADIRRVICASPAYLRAHGLPQHPRDLIGHRCISVAPLSTPDVWTFGVGTSLRSFPIARRLAATTSDATIDAALSSAGLARALHYQVVEHVARGDLILVLEDFEPEPSPLSLVYPASRFMPLKLRAFLDFAVPRLKQRLHAA
ncbi:LysR family transcriptional regulator [Sphingomonas sp.]|uniref:LysR family transcriptional regulator n=1 Tax=Sphingomonas sp. TaxID=28214 RepID=UPI0025ED5B5F|nr:LysR family transcriptional regulator [Sphingomonas sp.]